MPHSVLLSAILLLPAQPAGVPQPAPKTPPRGTDWSLSLHLERSQELVYRGLFTEECNAGTVHYQRAYRVESRLFVLDASPRGADLACMTTVRRKDAPIQAVGFKEETDGRTVRVERFQVDPQGKLTAPPGVDLVPPLEGPATLEVGAFVELPRGRFSVDQPWQTRPRAGQPIMTWSATGAEQVQGVRCAVLKGVQQSPDWDQPRGDSKGWRRTDTVWVAPRSGLALKIERVVEMREPAHTAPTQKAVFRADLESTLPYPGQLAQDRKADLGQAIALREAAQPLLATPNRFTNELNAVLKQITNHLDQTPPTPYRQAIVQVKARVEAALRGEILITPTTLPTQPAGLRVGQAAPDFVTTDITGKQSLGLKALRGQPVILAFYNPNSTLTPDLLRFLSELSAATEGKARILGLSISEDAAAVEKQLKELKTPLTVLQGGGLRLAFEVDATPRVILLDGQGYVRGAYTGWGRELPREVLSDLKPWLGKK